MQKVRRIAAAGVALVGLLAAPAAPASAAKKATAGPRPITQLLPSVDAGENEWISVYFKTDHKVCDFKMRVRGDQVEILHPNDWDYTSLNQNDTLRHKEVDYAAFRVNADVDETEWIPLTATITWNDCGSDDKTKEKKTSLILPVRA